MIQKKFNRNETIIAFHTKGSSCIDDAEYLFNNRRIQNYGTLLLQGIELLFKSFILLKDKRTTPNSLRLEYGHNYYKAYKKCQEIDDTGIFSNKVLEASINMLYESYEKDYVNLRYPSKVNTRSHLRNVFGHVRDGLVITIKPLLINLKIK